MDLLAARRREIPAQRAEGALELGFHRHGPATRIASFYQQGCLKARLPRPQTDGLCEAITINLSGGIAGGDCLATGIILGPGAAVSIASQAAERLYRSLGPPARLATSITLGPGASLDHLPQETILFSGFALQRRLDIHLAADADYLGVETIIFGRQAMGEVCTAGRLDDLVSVHRDGRLILRDVTRLHGDIAGQLGRAAIGGGAVAMASLILAGPDAPARLSALRAALAGHAVDAGASTFENIVFARLLAPDAASLRSCLSAAISACRPGRKLPRVWQG